MAFLGCASVEDAPDVVDEAPPSEPVGVAAQPIVKTTPSALAFPEFDLGTNAGFQWLPAATHAQIEATRATGYRVTSIDYVPGTNPPLFAASFIANSGNYARTGDGFNTSMSLVNLDAVRNDGNRRIVALNAYVINGMRQYAVAWVSNTGTQNRQYKAVVNMTPEAFQAEVTAFNGRVIDLSTQRKQLCNPMCAPTGHVAEFEVSGVMIKNTGADQRTQVLAGGDVKSIGAKLSAEGARVLDIDSVAPGLYYYVAEKVTMDPAFGASHAPGGVASPVFQKDERSWWITDQFYNRVDNYVHQESLAHAHRRYKGRFGKLRAYGTGTDRRYAGVVFENGDHVNKGSSNFSDPTLDELDAKTNSLMKKWGITGAVLAISQNGRLVHAKGYGLSDLQASRAALPTDSYWLGSVSKTLSGMLILRMIEQGLFTLDTKPFSSAAGALFPYTAPAGRSVNIGQITLRHLLEHSTGIDKTSSLFGANTSATWITAEAADPTPFFVNTDGTWAKPGERYEYQNGAYGIVADVIKKKTGQTFSQFLKSEVLDDLDIGTRILPGHVITGTDAPGSYQTRTYELPLHDCQFTQTAINNPTNTPIATTAENWSTSENSFASGTMIASPVDMLRWAASLDGSRPGFRALNNLTVAETGSNHWGLSWVTSTPPAGLTYTKGGYLPGGALAHMAILPNGFKYIVMSNSDSLKCQNAVPNFTTHEKGPDFMGDMEEMINDIVNSAKPFPPRDLFDEFGTRDFGFENQTTATPSTPWQRTGGVTIQSFPNIHSGTKSAELKSTSGTNEIFQTVPVTTNTDFFWSGHALTSAGAAGRLGARTTTGTLLGDASLVQSPTAWQQAGVIFNSGSNTSVNVFARTTGGSTSPFARVDTFSLRPVVDLDPAFEKQTGTELAAPWAGFGFGTSGVETGGGNPHGGNKNAWVITGFGSAMVYQTINLTSATRGRYLLTAFVRTSGSATGSCGVSNMNDVIVKETAFNALPNYTPITVDFFTGFTDAIHIYCNVDGPSGTKMQVDDVALIRL